MNQSDRDDVTAMALAELNALGERLSKEWSNTELTPEEIQERVNKWVDQFTRNMRELETPAPKVSVKTNPDGSFTLLFNARDFPWIKPTISDILNHWMELRAKGATSFMVHPDHASAWSRTDWNDELVRLSEELSRQMTATPTDGEALEEIEDRMVLFSRLAEACGHRLEIGEATLVDPTAPNGPCTVDAALHFDCATQPTNEKEANEDVPGNPQ